MGKSGEVSWIKMGEGGGFMGEANGNGGKGFRNEDKRLEWGKR